MGTGHNVPQEAPQGLAEASVEVGSYWVRLACVIGTFQVPRVLGVREKTPLTGSTTSEFRNKVRNNRA